MCSKVLASLPARGTLSSGPASWNPEPLEEVAHWTDQYRHIWDARFDVMNNVIQAMKDKADE